MLNNELVSEKYALLRKQAEERIKQWPRAYPSTEDCHRVIRELRIHLAEQEILNEALKKSITEQHSTAEAAYEFASPMLWRLN